jgi:hypothetical protein
MNVVWSRMLKSAYRKEPISSFIITIGLVDAVIGVGGDRWSLVAFGLGAAGVAFALRWWKMRQTRIDVPQQSPIYYLPDRSSSSRLPMLTASRRQPPSDRR